MQLSRRPLSFRGAYTALYCKPWIFYRNSIFLFLTIYIMKAFINKASGDMCSKASSEFHFFFRTCYDLPSFNFFYYALTASYYYFYLRNINLIHNIFVHWYFRKQLNIKFSEAWDYPSKYNSFFALYTKLWKHLTPLTIGITLWPLLLRKIKNSENWLFSAWFEFSLRNC